MEPTIDAHTALCDARSSLPPLRRGVKLGWRACRAGAATFGLWRSHGRCCRLVLTSAALTTPTAHRALSSYRGPVSCSWGVALSLTHLLCSAHSLINPVCTRGNRSITPGLHLSGQTLSSHLRASSPLRPPTSKRTEPVTSTQTNQRPTV
jgi:hypothetical protein